MQQQEASHDAEIFVKAIHVIDSIRACFCPVALPVDGGSTAGIASH
jgi:hypothetical protein